jgi:hypothetical protein
VGLGRQEAPHGVSRGDRSRAHVPALVVRDRLSLDHRDRDALAIALRVRPTDDRDGSAPAGSATELDSLFPARTNNAVIVAALKQDMV